MNFLRISAAFRGLKPFLFLCLLTATGLFGQDQKHQLLWKISSAESSKTSYLYGTMHLQDKRIFNFSDSLIPAINKSEVFALELHPDSMVTYLANELTESYSENIYKRILNEEEYAKLDAKFKEINGVHLDDYYTWNPIVIESSLKQRPPAEDEMPNFLDAYLYSLAFANGSEIKGLENVEDQMPGPEDLDDRRLKERILDILDTSDEEYTTTVEEMIALYAAGDLEGIYAYVSDHDGYNDNAMISRNKVMHTNMLQIMGQQSLFAAVGAAHLPGEDGLISLLRSSGLRVEPVAVTFNNPPDLQEITPNTDNWIENKYDEFGFSVKTPVAIEEMNMDPLKMYYGADLLTGLSFAYMLSDEIPMSVISAETIKSYLSIYFIEQGKEMEFMDQKEVQINGHSFYEGIMKNSDNEYIRFTIAAEKDYFMALYVQGGLQSINGPSANAFIESVSFYQPNEKPAYNGQWRTYTDKNAGFSVDIPDVAIIDRTNTVENPLDPESAPYRINIAFITDPDLEFNYLIRYNDQPSGYYLIDQEEILETLQDELQAGIELVEEPKPIEENGLKGFIARLRFFDTYDGVFKFLFRGNRTYAFLVQAKEEGVKVDLESRFFKSFKLEPLQKWEPESFEYEDLFSINVPAKPQLLQKEDGQPEDEFIETTSYAATSKFSGGVFMIEANKLNPYYRTLDSYAYFDDLLVDMLEYHDSVVSTERIKTDGIEALRAYIVNPNTNVKQYLQLMYVDDHLVHLLTCLGEEEIDQGSHLAFLDSFKYTRKQSVTDLVSSKVKDIVFALKSSDTLEVKKAQSALLFHDFDTDDVSELIKALSYEPLINYGYESSKSDLIVPITTYGNKQHLDQILEFYSQENTAPAVKEEIVSNLLNFKNIDSDKTLIDLLLKNPPPRTSESYFVFYQLEDSLDMIKKYPRQLAQLYKNDDFKDQLVDLYTNKIMDKEDLRELFGELREQIVDDISNQVVRFRDTSLTNNNHYLSESLMYSYMRMAESDPSVDAQASGKILEEIYTPYTKEPWLKTRALMQAMRMGFEVEATVLKDYMDPNYSRYEIMEALVNAEISDLIPAVYLSAEPFTELSVYNYAGNMMDSYDTTIEKLGELAVEDTLYGIYKVSAQDYANGEPIMFIAETKAADLEAFGSNAAYTDYSEVKSAWKLQARSLIRKYKREYQD